MRYPQVTSHPGGYYGNNGGMYPHMKNEQYHSNQFSHQHLPQQPGHLATADHHGYGPQMTQLHHPHGNKGMAGLQHPPHQQYPPQQDVGLPVATTVDHRNQVTCLSDVKNQNVTSSHQQQPISVAETKALLIDQQGHQGYPPQVTQHDNGCRGNGCQYDPQQQVPTTSLYSTANQVSHGMVDSNEPLVSTVPSVGSMTPGVVASNGRDGSRHSSVSSHSNSGSVAGHGGLNAGLVVTNSGLAACHYCGTDRCACTCQSCGFDMQICICY